VILEKQCRGHARLAQADDEDAFVVKVHSKFQSLKVSRFKVLAFETLKL
jgi:hypothetical protein